MSCIDDFAERCKSVVRKMSAKDRIMAERLIMLVLKVNKRHPFLFLPDFVDDVVGGLQTRDIMAAHRIASQGDYYSLVNDTVGLRGSRSKGRASSREKNLANDGWRERYDAIMLPSAAIHDQLVELYRCNTLAAAVADAVLRDRYIPGAGLLPAVLKSYDGVKARIHAPRAMHARGKQEECDDDRVRHVVSRLAAQGHVTYIDGNVSAPEKYSRIDSVVYEILGRKEDGVSYQALMSAAMQKLHLLKLVPSTNILDDCLTRLEDKGLIVHRRSTSGHTGQSMQIFAKGIYDRRMEEARSAAVSTKIKFFGRRTTPDQFVSELRRLDPGGLDDRDGQVARIAGLMMSDVAAPQGPRDPTGVFDFVVDVSDYEFRPEQVGLMERLDFEAAPAALHCKVMIDETVTASVLARLAYALPEGEQGVVFTCRKVPPAVAAAIKKDRSVQVIDKRGILEWCSIAPVTPCRKDSVVVVKYGDAVGRAAMVRALNYESGTATVILAPDRAEATLPIGSLKEVGPDAHSAGDELAEVSEAFFRLVCSLDRIAPGAFEDGIGECDAQVYGSRREMMEGTRPELFNDPTHPPYPVEPDASEFVRYVSFEGDTHVEITPMSGSTLACTCLHSVNEEYRTTLCRHMVAAIPAAIAREPDPLGAIAWTEKRLASIKEENVRRTSMAVGYALGARRVGILQRYLRARADEA